LAVGISACGSGSSSDASKSTSSVVKKEAGAFTDPVQLKVVNNLPDWIADRDRFRAYFDTTDTSGPFSVNLLKGESRTETGENGVSGEITASFGGSASHTVGFSSFNPDFGQPYIRLGGETFHLSEGETQTPTVDGLPFTLHRSDDTDVKVMQLQAG
jgi:hypothetical protein